MAANKTENSLSDLRHQSIVVSAFFLSKAVSASIGKSKQSAEHKQIADFIRISNILYLTTFNCMRDVISAEFLNFLNFGDGGGGGDEKQLVGLRQASGRRQKWRMSAD